MLVDIDEQKSRWMTHAFDPDRAGFNCHYLIDHDELDGELVVYQNCRKTTIAYSLATNRRFWTINSARLFRIYARRFFLDAGKLENRDHS